MATLVDQAPAESMDVGSAVAAVSLHQPSYTPLTALAVRQKSTPAEVDLAEVRALLREHGAIVPGN